MSHNVTVKGVAIRSIPALTKAVSNLRARGVPISIEKRERFKTYARQPDRCDYAIHIDGANHEIGVLKSADKPGEYEFVFDPYSDSRTSSIAHFLGMKGVIDDPNHTVSHAQRAIGQLTQEHALCAAEEKFENEGWSFERQIDAKTGVIQSIATLN
jgi:hypothetical protein